MPFDPQLVEAQLALGMIGSEEMPKLAWDVLESGLDGPVIRRMAALIRPLGWETDQYLPKFMAEAGLKGISCEEASIRLARRLTLRILAEELDPLDYTRDFERLWILADYASAIGEAGTLDDEKAVAEYVGQSESELREYARTVLRTLIASEESTDQGASGER